MLTISADAIDQERQMVEVVIPSDLTLCKGIQEQIAARLKAHGFSDKECFGVRLALEEAIVNAIRHGNESDRNKKVTMQYAITPHRFDFAILDEGPGFVREDVADCLEDENRERPSGRGLFLMDYYMTEVTIHPPGNKITMHLDRRLAKKQQGAPPDPAVGHRIQEATDGTQANVETTFGQ